MAKENTENGFLTGSTQERPKPFGTTQGKPEKPANVFDIAEARKKITARETPFVFPDTESAELMETVSGLVKKLFDDSRDKKTVVDQLRKLADELEQKLDK